MLKDYEQIRLESLALAVKAFEVGLRSRSIVERAAEFENYIKNGKEEPNGE